MVIRILYITQTLKNNVKIISEHLKTWILFLTSRNISIDYLSIYECNVKISTRWFGCHIFNYTHKYFRWHLNKAQSDPTFVLSEFSCIKTKMSMLKYFLHPYKTMCNLNSIYVDQIGIDILFNLTMQYSL